MKSKIAAAVIFFYMFCSTSSFIAQIKVDEKSSLARLKENLEVLASEQYEGRETTTRGEKLAASFIAEKLEKYGIKPYGDNRTYFENFKLLSSGYYPESKISLVDQAGSNISDFFYGEELLKSTNELCDSLHGNQTTGIVFAAYGITAPEFDYDDYAGIDVKGKTVLLLDGEPYSQRDDFFDGVKVTKYSIQEFKIRTAIEKGAAGVLIIPDERMKTYWAFFKDYVSRPSLSFVSKGAETEHSTIPIFLISETSIKKMLNGESESYDIIERIIKEKDIPHTFELTKKLKYSTNSFSKMLDALNVIGIIEGTDSVLKNEYVAISAHFDHEGVKNGVVFNGADDDGSGTVAVLEAMKILSETKNNKRSILGVFHTGEEKGLLGSKYVTDNGSFIKNVVADINMDMVGRESPDSLHCIGSDKLSTEFGKLIKDVNAKTVNFVLNYKYDDPNDPQRFYYRSDHFNYAVKGIPVVFFFDDMKTDYHKATDDVDKINFDKILKTTILAANVAHVTSNLDHKPVVDKKTGELLLNQNTK
jgi:hypothetical protein